MQKGLAVKGLSFSLEYDFIHPIQQKLQCIESIGISVLKELLAYTLCGKKVPFFSGITKTLSNDLETAFSEYCLNETTFLPGLKNLHNDKIYNKDVKHIFLDKNNLVRAKIDFCKFDLPLYTKILKTNHFKIHLNVINKQSIEFLEKMRILLHHRVEKDYWNNLENSPDPILIDYIKQKMTKDGLLNKAGLHVEDISNYLFRNSHFDQKKHEDIEMRIEFCKNIPLERMTTALCDNCLLYTSPSPRDS